MWAKEMSNDDTTRPDRARFRTGQHAGTTSLSRMARVVLGAVLQPSTGFHPGLHDRTGRGRPPAPRMGPARRAHDRHVGPSCHPAPTLVPGPRTHTSHTAHKND